MSHLASKEPNVVKKGCTVLSTTGGSELPDASVALFSVAFSGWESSTGNPILRLEFLMVHWSEIKFVESTLGKCTFKGCLVWLCPWIKSRFFGAPVFFWVPSSSKLSFQKRLAS